MVFINHEYAEMYHINLNELCDGTVNAASRVDNLTVAVRIVVFRVHKYLFTYINAY